LSFPVSVYEKPSVDCDENGEEKTRQHGFGGVTRLNLADPLKLILGARVSCLCKPATVFAPVGATTLPARLLPRAWI
jgi:hypothetical protein